MEDSGGKSAGNHDLVSQGIWRLHAHKNDYTANHFNAIKRGGFGKVLGEAKVAATRPGHWQKKAPRNGRGLLGASGLASLPGLETVGVRVLLVRRVRLAL